MSMGTDSDTRLDSAPQDATRKVVVNRCHGGFSLSRAAFLRLRAMGNAHALAEPDFGELYSDGSGPRKSYGGSFDDHFCSDIPRDDPQLIEVVEDMGDAANGMCARLDVTEIPADVSWQIEEYDGLEWIAESHRTW